MKTRRQALLLKMMENGLIDSQETAVSLLNKEGITATQATVSRDFDEIGAVKVRHGEEIRYEVRASASPYGASLTRVLKDFILEKYCSQNMLVLKTPPGHAAIVAAALDREGPAEILGTIAGDDTIFACCKDSARKTVKILDSLLS